jgi:hypothetical protein
MPTLARLSGIYLLPEDAQAFPNLRQVHNSE